MNILTWLNTVELILSFPETFVLSDVWMLGTVRSHHNRVLYNTVPVLQIAHQQWKLILCHTVRCPYNTVNFFQNPHKIHPIAPPLGWAMGCPLVIQILIYILLQSLQWCIWYRAVRYHTTGLYLELTKSTPSWVKSDISFMSILEKKINRDHFVTGFTCCCYVMEKILISAWLHM